MLASGSGFYVRIPDEAEQRILHPATVVEIKDAVCTARIEEDGLPLEAGQELLIYFERQREFMQQAARIDALLEMEPKLLIGFQTTGKPVSAENRQCYRVSTVISNLIADVGGEQGCPLLDVSATGFSVIASASFCVGSIVPATLHHDGRTFGGDACIQSIRELEPGRTRYGLHVIEDRAISGDLQKGIQSIGMAVQRQQLRRLAGG